MELPHIILDDLKCDTCGVFLNRGPVMLDDAGKNVCGRCPLQNSRAIENTPYNELAKMVSFPCRYQPVGCPRYVPFLRNKTHEETCPYRPSICPIAEPGECSWIGHLGQLLNHCEEDHPEIIVPNPVVLTHDINEDIKQKFLMKAYDVVFLIYNEVCHTTRKLYHSVQVIGDPQHDYLFFYEVIVVNKDDSLTKLRRITPYGAPDDNLVETTNLDALLDILGGYQTTSFVIKPELQIIAERGTSAYY